MISRIFTRTALWVAMIAIVTACSPKKEEKPSPLLGKAVETATLAAEKLVQTDHNDTMAMQKCILEAKTMQTEFQVADDTAAINAFNRTFKKYLQENDPSLAKEIFIERPKDLPNDEPWDEFEQLVEDSVQED